VPASTGAEMQPRTAASIAAEITAAIELIVCG
jgi:hypothetical protein